jgi:hypothetical protein
MDSRGRARRKRLPQLLEWRGIDKHNGRRRECLQLRQWIDRQQS